MVGKVLSDEEELGSVMIYGWAHKFNPNNTIIPAAAQLLKCMRTCFAGGGPYTLGLSIVKGLKIEEKKNRP